jgi:hypothetical protein
MCGEMLLASDGTAVPVEVIEARTYSASHLTKSLVPFYVGPFQRQRQGYIMRLVTFAANQTFCCLELPRAFIFGK